MADITQRSAVVPHVPLRAVGMALLVIAALLAVVAMVVGSRQTRLPPPFGLAQNGLVAYAADGDILIYDPATGTTRPLVSGPEIDHEPMFSYDGSRIGWTRTTTTSGSPAQVIVVADADGSDMVVVTPNTIGTDAAFEWAPDSRALIVASGGDLWIYGAERSAGPPQLLAEDAVAYHKPFRPPLGEQVMITRMIDDRVQLLLRDVRSHDETVVVEGDPGVGIGTARWSPDGTQILYGMRPESDPDSERLFIVNADGTGARQITRAPGTWYDIDPTWSPDGTRIAFTRYERVAPDDWQVRPTGIYSIADGSLTEVGPLPRDVRAQHPSSNDGFATPGEGFFLEWAPDGQILFALHSEAAGHPVMINPADGSWRVLDPVAEAGDPLHAWQRTALDP
ncbi:MAG TPA: hypothetical protein VFO73_14670 [Candidatus Limnocylindrales bacterium]|nr:hypothetical protein [Candidatus Limnocylindrales bacterium]